MFGAPAPNTLTGGAFPIPLVSEPRPRGARKLAGFDDVYRIRVGVLRVLYSIEGRRLVVIVLKVGQRKDVYR